MIDAARLLENLNDAQRDAVLATEGPVLILAGAGSGKTRVITHRVAYLIATARARPWQVIAITFTNKAAGEMKERVARLAGSDAEGLRIGTFHALCLRILRREAARAGLAPGFQIYDTADQLGIVRAVLKELGIDEGEMTPRAVLSRISAAKNKLLRPDEFAQRAVLPEARTVARCYEEYQKALRKAGGVDFDDLLLETLDLFARQPDVSERYARGCRYLLVDEYQDTNQVQYRLVRALSAAHGNICCVADPDQSIYRFRGADPNNIADFEKDHPDALIVKLEQNYRSTSVVLKAAAGVIAKNSRRHEKKLWTENEEGAQIHYHRARDDRDEAEAVARILASLQESFASGEIAVLYRTNNQSRLIEDALVRAGIRYRIVGSLRFYDRKEIKDLLAYLRLLLVPDDDLAFQRAVNTPARGIGKTTLDQIAGLAASRGLSFHQAARTGIAEGLLSPRAAAPLGSFFDLLDDLRARTAVGSDAPGSHRESNRTARVGSGASSDASEGGAVYDGDLEDAFDFAPTEAKSAPPVLPLVTRLLDATQFREHLARMHPGDFEERVGNVEALASAAAEYDEQDPGGGLQGFLDRSSLRGDTDDVQGDTGVTLLTVHSAKGLEFSAVVLTGLEENIFPHFRSIGVEEDVEEERRLCYVAITRSKKRLVVTNAFMRRSFGDFVENPPSRFLDEIPQDLLLYSESSPYAGVIGDPLRAGAPAGSPPAGRSGLGLPSRSPGDRPSWSAGMGGTSGGYRESAGGYRTSSGRGGGNRGSGAGGGFRSARPAASRSYAADPGGGDDFAVGRIVTHPMFGRGTILQKEGAGESLKLTIRFQSAGTKRIMPRGTTLVVHD